jgi:hypothetical protein
MSNLSDFTISEINHEDRVVILEDKELGLSIEIPFDDKGLVDAKVVEPYSILLSYEDSTTEKKQILE